MLVSLITPSLGPDGNLITARRYSRILKGLGHRVRLQRVWDRRPCDMMIALHARRSHSSIVQFQQKYPRSPLVVVLTGTDLYQDLNKGKVVLDSLERATRLVLLQEQADKKLPPAFSSKSRVIYQSAETIVGVRRPSTYFRIAVIGNLRAEKDPLRAAYAVRRLPESSRVRVFHAGRSTASSMKRAAIRETKINPRYRWLGELPHWRSRRLIAGSHLLIVTSRIEGSSNALSEALASYVPCLASAIPGLIGTLGQDYPAYYQVGDTAALTKLIVRAESDSSFYDRITSHCHAVRHLVAPEREFNSWKSLLSELPTMNR
jgi:putative glycosyltransferase (TIGR04348 family)